MKIINIEPKNEIKVKNIEGFLKGKVTWYGTGAKVDCPKRYLGQDVYLVILKKKDGKSNRRKSKTKEWYSISQWEIEKNWKYFEKSNHWKRQRNCGIKKKLRQYINENTPSSLINVYTKPVMKSPNRPPVGTNPRGKPLGGNGATRKIPKKIDKKIEVNFTNVELKK